MDGYCQFPTKISEPHFLNQSYKLMIALPYNRVVKNFEKKKERKRTKEFEILSVHQERLIQVFILVTSNNFAVTP